MTEKPIKIPEQTETTIVDLGTIDTRSGEPSTTKSK